MHPVVQLINKHGLSALEEKGIKIRWSTVHPEKFTANYDQILADEHDPIVQECRGLVLAQLKGEQGQPGEYRVVAQPFRRFFNHGQGAAASLDWDSVRFEEKLDGTLMIVYWYGKQWNVATRGTPDADVPCADGKTFADKFFECLDQDDHEYTIKLLEWNQLAGCTWLFEYTAPDNQIVLPYEGTRLTCLGLMNTDNSTELSIPEEWEYKGLYRPVQYVFNDLEHCWAWIHAQPGSKLEGLIAVDRFNKRLKLKNTQYLALSKVMTSAGSDKGIVELLLEGKVDDVIPFVSKARADDIKRMEERLQAWMKDLDSLNSYLKTTFTERKQTALYIQSHYYKHWMNILMDIWTGKAVNVLDWIQLQKQRTNDKSLPNSLLEKITADLT